jgi:glutamate-5-semialdehyde dehydrogenase
MNLSDMGERAVAASYRLQTLTTAEKNHALEAAAQALLEASEKILAANAQDIAAAEKAGISPALIDRLRLDEKRLNSMAEGLREIVKLPDPIGEVLETFERPSGIKGQKVRVPLGVIGVIYESRPNVTADAFGLCFKAGNAVILKGGSDALNSNRAITQALRETLANCLNIPDALQLIESTDRAVINELMRLNRYVNVLIPRGGAGLIQTVVENSTVPVIETGTGNCHIYIDESAELEKAIPIIVNAKTQRVGVCNACESLVIHERVLSDLLKMLAPALAPYNVELRCDETSLNALKSLTLDTSLKTTPATEEDYAKEYLDYIMSVKTVQDVGEAIAHINKYNTKHSDAIITKDKQAAARFLKEVDAACVYVNTSTRFSDGFEFGFGAEIGISTQKLHARGPMGLRELTSYKYLIESDYLSRS